MIRRLPVQWSVAIFFVAATSHAQPHVSDEISLDPPVSSIGPGTPTFVAGSQGAGVWLVTWHDDRELLSGPSLYAARVSIDGTLLDPGGIRLTGGTAGDAAVTFDGTRFVVVWSDSRADPTSTDLYAARITPDGSDLDPGGTLLIARPNAQLSPALASNGTQLLVTWTDSSTDASRNIHSSVWAQGVDPAALVPVGAAVSVPASTDNESDSRVVWNGANWVVGYRSWPIASIQPSNFALDVARIDVNGGLLDAAPRLISSAVTYYSGFELASDSNVTVVAYTEDPSGVDEHLRAARLGQDGAPLTPSPVEVAHPGVLLCHVVGVGVTSGTFEVAWSNTAAGAGTAVTFPAATTVQRLNADGTTPAPASFSLFVGASASSPTDVQGVVFGPQGLLALRGTSTLNFQRYTPTGGATDPTPVAVDVASNVQRAPQAAWNGDHYYVSWLDDRAGAGTHRAFGVAVDSAGSAPSTPAGALASTASNQAQLLLAGGAGTFLALWSDDRVNVPGQSGTSIVATRIDDGGSVMDSMGIQVASNLFFFPEAGAGYNRSSIDTATSMAFDGKVFLAGYGASVWDGTGWGAFSIGLDGAVKSIYLPLPIGSPWGSPNVQIASTGGGSLVEGDWNSSSGFVVTTLGSTGSTANGSVPLRPSFDTRSNRYVTVKSIASDGAGYLLVFADYPNQIPSSAAELWVWRFDATGTATTVMPTQVAAGITTSTTAQLVFDGNGYLLVWDRFDSIGQADVVGLRIARDGSPLTTDPFVIAGTSWNEAQPSAASDGSGHILVTYSRFDDSPTFGSMRARARVVDVTHQPVGGPCAGSSDCLGGSCVGGTCCEGECGREPMPEASADDASESEDAPESLDAGSESSDSTETPEGGTSDATASDATTSGVGSPADRVGGCGCRTAASQGGSGGWVVCIAALLLRRRMRRVRRDAPIRPWQADAST